MNIFIKPHTIKSVLYVRALMVFKFIACLVQEKINAKFLLASLKTLTNSKKCSESHIKFLFWLSFALIGRFFPVYIHTLLSEQFSGSQAGYGTTFRETQAAIRKSE
jgi:hypothetical protein